MTPVVQNTVFHCSLYGMFQSKTTRVRYLESYTKKNLASIQALPVSNRHSTNAFYIPYTAFAFIKVKKRYLLDIYFYNNCLISRELIGSFLSSRKVQTEQILSYMRAFHSLTFSCRTISFLTNESFIALLGSQSESKKTF